MPTAPVNGTLFHYLDAGREKARETILLLHAFPLHSGMWKRQVAALSPYHRVIAPDYRGFGKTSPDGDVSSMALIASDVRQLLHQLHIERAVVVGLSMGGYLAFELFREDPGLFRGLVLCDTRATSDSAEGRAGREVFAKNALERGLSFVADEMVPKLLREGASPQEETEVRELIGSVTPLGVAAAQRAMAARPDSTPTLSKIGCPSLVVVGEGDRFVPVAEAENLARGITGAGFVTVDRAGHLPCIEAPAAFNGALLAFLYDLGA